MLEREFARSIIARFDKLFNNDRFANEISAVTRVIIILKKKFFYNNKINNKKKKNLDITGLQNDALNNQKLLFASYLSLHNL